MYIYIILNHRNHDSNNEDNNIDDDIIDDDLQVMFCVDNDNDTNDNHKRDKK